MEVSSEQELSGRARKEIGAFGGGGVGGRGVRGMCVALRVSRSAVK